MKEKRWIEHSQTLKIKIAFCKIMIINKCEKSVRFDQKRFTKIQYETYIADKNQVNLKWIFTKFT